jgi:Uma2 family endonuclease
MTTRVQEDAKRNLSLESMVVRLPRRQGMTDDELLEFSSLNPDLRIEQTSEGDLIIMPPAGGETGGRNAEITTQLRVWAKQDGTGRTFDSSTGFRLSNRAVRSPDASWVSKARWEALSEEQRKKYPRFALTSSSSFCRQVIA